MTGTTFVLVFVLTFIRPLASLVYLVAACVLARRDGLRLKKLSWSSFHGYTAEFDSERN
jgi:hypothetical protein